MRSPLLFLLFQVAFTGPFVGVIWLASVVARRTSIKEILALTAFWAVVFLAWIKWFQLVAPPPS